MSNNCFENDVFNTIINDLKANIYVTDIETDEIIFMNEEMKKSFHIEDPIGKICWQVLQKGLSSRCEFCPVNRLKHQNDPTIAYQWDEINPVNQRSYHNRDSFIKWVDGRMVHLQQSIDTTELKSANTDELTQFYTRRYGKEKLKMSMQNLRNKNETLSVCLYDINSLKQINDRYGHVEGDRAIVTISEIVKSFLPERSYGFRLSGDEFVIVLKMELAKVRHIFKLIDDKLASLNELYPVGFCYGFAESRPNDHLTVDEILFLADKRMYEQKRHFHISTNERNLMDQQIEDEFIYNTERLYDALVKSTDDYIYVSNMKSGTFKYTQAMIEEFNLPSQVIKNAASIWGAKVHPDDKAGFLEANQEIADGRTRTHCVEYRVLNRNKEWVWVRCRGYLECDLNGEPILFAGFITNLGNKNRIDNLTGLYNKIEFENQINHLVDTDQDFSIMVLGIDDLKHINDLYNRTFGDEVIRIVAQKIRSIVPANALLCRLGGDEFGILLRNASRDQMHGIYRTISHIFGFQQEYNHKKYYCTLSAGCLFYPSDATSYEDIISVATFCLEYSKSHGKKRCTYFSNEIVNERKKSLEMLEILRESIENNFAGFSLMFQPLVEAKTGKVVGAEALARWYCEKYGQVSPMVFIPVLEESGLINQAGKWILKKALEASKDWINKDPDFVIDVNLSYVQMQDLDFLTYLSSQLERLSFPPKNLVLELTESYFVDENDRLNIIFNSIRDLGIRIAMDDFGTGYSSLGILKESPTDIVKIDKTFVKDVDSHEFDGTLIRFVVELCHTVGIQVCLEGVELDETYETVLPMGLDLIQGYLFGKPVSEKEFTLSYFKK